MTLKFITLSIPATQPGNGSMHSMERKDKPRKGLAKDFRQLVVKKS